MQTPLTSCATDNNQVRYTRYLYFIFLSIDSSEGGVARKNSRVEYYLSIKRICLAILPHSDNSVFHTYFSSFSFFLWGRGFRYSEIFIANPYCIFFVWQ